MKIVANTPTQLIIRDSAMTMRGLGAFIAALGAYAIWLGVAQDPDGQIGVVPTVLGSLVALGGLALLAIPPRKTFAFSKTERVFVIATERFGRVHRQTIPLRDIADVSLEESSSSDSASTYRVAVTLADRRRIPWTSYYTSGLVSKRAIVQIVREFLDLEPTPGLGSSAPTAKDERDARRAQYGLYAAGLFFCGFLGVGVTMVAKEQRRLSVFQPVTATVMSTRVEEHSSSNGSTYEPVVAYRYEVNGREYVASGVTPLTESRSGRWAYRVSAHYQAANNYTAFYDPANPAEAFLMRSRSIIPWAFIGIPLIAILGIGAGIRGNRELTRMSSRARFLS